MQKLLSVLVWVCLAMTFSGPAIAGDAYELDPADVVEGEPLPPPSSSPPPSADIAPSDSPELSYTPAETPQLGDAGVDTETLTSPDGSSSCHIDISDGCGDEMRTPPTVLDGRGESVTAHELGDQLAKAHDDLRALRAGETQTYLAEFLGLLGIGRTFEQKEFDLSHKIDSLQALLSTASRYTELCVETCEEGYARAAIRTEQMERDAK